jgi:pyoverdine/dityrosine biosynthesis protein Dit1
MVVCSPICFSIMETASKIQLGRQDVVRMRSVDFMVAPVGTVLLVRSSNVKEMGDHFIVITGGLIHKKHGLRPQTLAISDQGQKALLDQFEADDEGVILLRLDHPARERFLYRFGIAVFGQEVKYPYSLVVDEILRIFEEFRLPPTVIDQYEVTGREKLADRIMGFLRKNEPIRFSMLGYPFKSKNTRDKVLGVLPDLGEEKSLENFGYLNDRIKQVYEPGVQFSIISDGYIFSDVWGIPDASVLAYNEITKDLAKNYPIKLFDAGDFYQKETSMYNIREKIIGQFGITAEELERRILNDLNVNTLYRGMIIFMTEEFAMMDFPSRNQREKFAKIKAREAMFRNEAYSAMVQENFKDHIRLSMHNSTNDGTKYSIQLIHGKYKYSPWHSCLVVHADGTLETVHRGEAVSKGYELVNQDGRPYYFQEV